jgi:hypothetical protein
MEILSKASLIGYLEGNMKGLIHLIESIPEKERTYSEKRTIETLKDAIARSEEAWERVKMSM